MSGKSKNILGWVLILTGLALLVIATGVYKGYRRQCRIRELEYALMQAEEQQEEQEQTATKKHRKHKSFFDKNGEVPYQKSFKKHAPRIGWDWELLAAVGYHESRFNPDVVSPSGARGVMQLMPATARKFGLNDSTMQIPEDNIAASILYIARLQRIFACVSDSCEQTKFVLASYNSGTAHILDARRLAERYGKNANRWEDVEAYLARLNEESFYTDSVVKYGSFNAGTTIKYVHAVLNTCTQIKNHEKNKEHKH